MRSAIRAMVVSLLFLLLASCNQMAMKQRQEKLAATKSYCESLYADSRIDPIRKKIPITLSMERPVPSRFMINDARPTDDEKAAILVWIERRQLCQQNYAEILGAPSAHLSAARASNSQGLADLYSGKITFGEFSRRYNRNRSTYLQQDAAFRIEAQREALQQQQAFQQQFFQQQQSYFQQQLIQNQPMQQSTRSMNCATQYVGNEVYANCS